MERREQLKEDSIDFLPTEHKAATNIFRYLEREDIIEFQNSEKPVRETAIVEAHDEESLRELGKLALFVFRHEDKEDLGNNEGFNHIILGDGSIASLWIDGNWYLVPGDVNSQVKRQPFEKENPRHAHGKCDICPTLNILRYNFGHSDFNNPQLCTPALPDTSAYSEGESEEDCLECKNNISEWFCERIREDERYLWLFGGSGLHYNLPIQEDGYDFLDILNDSQPPTETEVDDSELRSVYSDTDHAQDDYPGSETGSELLLNQILGIQMYSRFGFDDLVLNCEAKEPVEINYELDIILIDYGSQKMVVIETTTARSRNNHLSQKHNAATQLKALSTYYENLEIEYIYLTTEDFPGGIERTSGTWILHQSMERMGIPFKIIRRPDGLDYSALHTNGMPTTTPEEIDKVISELYEHIIDELDTHIRGFLNPD
jgi:hypothetical protein